MTFNERYVDILKDAEWFTAEYGDTCLIENDIIKEVNIVVTGHFGNTVSVLMTCTNSCPFPLYSSTANIGYILRALIEIFDKDDDSSVNINELVGTPIRIVYDDSE